MFMMVPLFVIFNVINVIIDCSAQSIDDQHMSTTLVPKVPAHEIIQDLVNATYDRRIRPPNIDEDGVNQPIEVKVNTYIRSMSNIDFVKMEYSLQITFRQKWQDKRLAYAHRGERVPKFIIITKEDVIWKPDTFFMNEKRAHRHDIDTPNLLFRVHPDGQVLYSQRISLVISCPIQMKKFPMDSQSCSMDFGSYAYSTDDIIYEWEEKEPIQEKPGLKHSLPCFTLDSINTDYCTSITNTGNYSCLRAVLSMHRDFSYYMIQVYIPSTLLVIVSWVSFWLERSAVPARVTLGVTTLLTMTTQAASINSALPPVSYIKAIDIWLGTCLFFIFSAVMEFAYVSLVASSGEIIKKKRRNCGHHDKSASPDEKNTEEEDLLSGRTEKSTKGLIEHVQKDESKIIDKRARIVFPVMFVIFQLLYWSWYFQL